MFSWTMTEIIHTHYNSSESDLKEAQWLAYLIVTRMNHEIILLTEGDYFWAAKEVFVR